MTRNVIGAFRSVIIHNYANVWSSSQSKSLPGFRLVTSLNDINGRSIQTYLKEKTTRSNRLKFRLVFSLERVWSPINGFLCRPRGSQSGCGNDAKNVFKHGRKSTRVPRLTRSSFQITQWKPASGHKMHEARCRGGGGTQQISFGEASPEGPAPCPFIFHLWQKRYPYPFHIPRDEVFEEVSDSKTYLKFRLAVGT